MPLVLVAAVGAYLFMNNLRHVTTAYTVKEMWGISRKPHTVIMSILYIGTFGSFIGFSFAFGQVLQVQFAEQFDTPIKAASLTFLGPLIGSLIRPFGGKLADRFGGSRVTILNFCAMAAATSLVLVASIVESLPLFIVAFIGVFTLSGLGNGSTYKMIPAIFQAKAAGNVAAGADMDAEARNARRMSRSLIGIAGSIGAFGGVFVNLGLRQSFLSNGSADAAYVGFIAFYLVCVAVTWAVYLRPSPRRLAGV
jgi:NNP family nitrate/nitrite transporter-like MFS transporter